MQLHQLLRFITYGTPILLFDVQGVEICKVASKDDINIDLYEYLILDISVGIVDFRRNLHGMYITIQK